jgi:hypothetical protein
MMHRYASQLLAAAATLVSVWSIWYFLNHLSSSSFLEGAMGNLFATILGVLVGVPIALGLNRRQQAAASQSALLDRRLHEDERKRKILTLLRSELQQNKNDVLKSRKPMETGGQREIFVGSLNDQLWSAFSDGGELQFINSPSLLAGLADAYYRVRICITLERKMLDIVHFPGMRVQQYKSPEEFIREYLADADTSLLRAIDRVLAAIDTELLTLAGAE